MILEIDMGNTWAKWRVTDGVGVLCRGKTLSSEFPSSDVAALKGIKRIRLASVTNPVSVERVRLILSTALGADIFYAETVAQQVGLTNAYKNPSSMGVDRWLAMLASYHYQDASDRVKGTAKRGCLVVSCGTAVTIDLVRGDGVHEGGYILPGLMMMRDALLSRTGRIQYSPRPFDISRAWGDSTATAVEHGAVHAVLSALEQAYADCLLRWGGCEFFLTGGDAPELRRFLSVPCHHVEELVLDGLQYAVP